jgi:hypothetical protein
VVHTTAGVQGCRHDWNAIAYQKCTQTSAKETHRKLKSIPATRAKRAVVEAHTVARCTVVEKAISPATVSTAARAPWTAAAGMSSWNASISATHTVTPTDTAVISARTLGPTSVVLHTVAPTATAATAVRSRGAAAASPTTLMMVLLTGLIALTVVVSVGRAMHTQVWPATLGQVPLSEMQTKFRSMVLISLSHEHRQVVFWSSRSS